jgi:hypothetical protein
MDAMWQPSFTLPPHVGEIHQQGGCHPVPDCFVHIAGLAAMIASTQDDKRLHPSKRKNCPNSGATSLCLTPPLHDP